MYVDMWDALEGGDSWVQTAVYRNPTWVRYQTDGSQIFVLNSGTWSDGPPAAPAGAASSASAG